MPFAPAVPPPSAQTAGARRPHAAERLADERFAKDGAAPRRIAPRQILVKLRERHTARARADGARAARGPIATRERKPAASTRRRVSVGRRYDACGGAPDVAWAIPDYRERAAGGLIPNDSRRGQRAGRLAADAMVQWTSPGPFGVKRSQAWSNVAWLVRKGRTAEKE